MRIVLSLTLLVGAWLTAAAPAAADCQPAGPIQEALPAAPVVFVGTVADLVGSMALFQVTEVWAGQVGPTVEVHGLTSGVEFSEDDRQWTSGATYLVVPIVEGAVLRDSLCTATTEWSDELAPLRPATARILTAAPEAAGGIPPALLLAGAVVLLVAAVSVLAFRRR